MAELAADASARATTIDARSLSKAERRIFATFTVLLVAMAPLQMIGIPTPQGPLELILPVTWVAFGYLALFSQIRVDLGGMLLFLAFAFLAIAGNFALAAQAGDFKITSLLEVLSIYALYIFRVDVSDALFALCMNRFISMMLLTIPIIIAQWGLQVAIHPGLWLGIQDIVPKPMFLVFNYIHPLTWNSPWIQPNGAVFLEVSELSQFLTLALILELCFFKRVWRLVALSGAMVATFAASGPFMLILCSPFLLFSIQRRLIPYVVVALLAFLALATFTDVFSILFSRTAETSTTGTSAYVRLTAPFETIRDALLANTNPFQGIGAGMSDQMAGAFLPAAKMITEYGAVCTISFLALFFYTICRSGQPPLVICAFAVVYQLMGGSLAVPADAIAVTLFCGLLARRPARATNRRSQPESRRRGRPGRALCPGASRPSAARRLAELHGAPRARSDQNALPRHEF